MREREKRECGTGITRGGVALGTWGLGSLPPHNSNDVRYWRKRKTSLKKAKFHDGIYGWKQSPNAAVSRFFFFLFSFTFCWFVPRVIIQVTFPREMMMEEGLFLLSLILELTTSHFPQVEPPPPRPLSLPLRLASTTGISSSV